MTPIHLGIVGCGGHAQHHAEHLPQDFSIRAIWDPDQAAMEKIESPLKMGTIEALINSSTIEAVLICSPDEYHLEQIDMALKAGKHVFCEKPLLIEGQSITALKDMFEYADEKGLVLTTCHLRRFDKPFVWLKSEVLARRSDFPVEFGKVLHISFDFSYHVPSNDWKHGRSLLLDHLNHEVDLMNYLFGIQGFNAWKIHDGFDHYEVAGKRDDEISFHFMGTRRLMSSKYPEWCNVRFERGEIRLDMLMGLAYIIGHDSGATMIVPHLDIDYEGRLEHVMKNFAESIGRSNRDYSQAGKLHAGDYLSRAEMLMNTEAGIILQYDGIKRISIRA
jgi:predicted dehydrogenase